MNFDTPSLKGRALRLLSLREHSRLELEQKLAQYEQAPGTLAAALDELQAKGFISAQRVLESVVHHRAGKLGAARIKQELQAKGLPADLVAAAVAELRGSELTRAQAIWRQRFGRVASEPKERARQARFLAARGFAGDVVRRVIDGGDDTDCV